MQPDLDSFPLITPRQAYLAMYEFLSIEFDLAGADKMVHLGGLLTEVAPERGGSTGDPGAAETFAEALQKVLTPGYSSPWSLGDGGI